MVKIKFHGHACFEVSGRGYNLIIDPWLSGNPMADIGPDKIKAEYILVTHGHGDHLGDAVKIAIQNNGTIIAPYELATFCQQKGAKAHSMHIGGGYSFEFGYVKLTQALHGSSVVDGSNICYTGNPCGFLIQLEGKTIYHAGDTGLFGDMKLLGDKYKIDAALIPIGDNFVMGIDDAVTAVEFLKPRIAVPMHYNTFDVIKQDPVEFKNKVEGKNLAEVKIVQPGDTLEI